jgi:hypothetical protein
VFSPHELVLVLILVDIRPLLLFTGKASRLDGPSYKFIALTTALSSLQAACTPKELKELVNLPQVAIHATPSQLQVSAGDQAVMKATRMKRRIYDLISTVSCWLWEWLCMAQIMIPLPSHMLHCTAIVSQ